MDAAIFLVVYTACAFAFLPMSNAVTVFVIMAIAVPLVLWLTHARTLKHSLLWFKRFPLRGGFVGLLTTFGTALQLWYVTDQPLASHVLSGFMLFFWFWTFAAIPTHSREK